jgi:hypothetical protein
MEETDKGVGEARLEVACFALLRKVPTTSKISVLPKIWNVIG